MQPCWTPYAIVFERKLVVKLRVEIIALLLDRCGFSLPCDRTGQRVGPFGTQYLYTRLVVVADDVVFQNESVVAERLTESEIEYVGKLILVEVGIICRREFKHQLTVVEADGTGYSKPDPEPVLADIGAEQLTAFSPPVL